VNPFVAVNAVLRFALELCMLAAFAYWGSRTSDSTVVNVALAIVAPLAAATVWGILLAPRSSIRLPPARRIPVEVALFGLATAALADVDQPGLAIAFGVTAAVNTTIVHLQGEI
jgi:hypothetical protein